MEALGLNLPGLITQLVSFTILFAVLYKLLYKPILQMLDNRSERIKESLETATRVREESIRSHENMEKQLEAARTEGQDLIVQAREVADRFRKEELAKAREEIDAQRTRAQANIQREGETAIEELRREFAGLAIAAAEQIIEKSLDDDAHRELIEKVLEEASGSDRN